MNVFDIRPLLTLRFWFMVNPDSLLPFFERAFFVVYLLALAAAVVLGVLGQRKKDPIERRFFEKMRRKETIFGSIGLLLSFFSYERTPFLSMRFFTGLLWLGTFLWAVMILRWRFRIAPTIERSIAEQKEFEKYLP